MTRPLVGLALLLVALLVAVERAAPAQAAATLAAVTVTERVTGGGDVTVTVTLTGRAAASTRVKLTSSSRAALPTASSVTVAAGRSTASVTVPSVPVARSTTVRVTAELGGVAESDTVTVLPPALASVRLPESVGGGLSVDGTVTLTGPAPSGGIVVALKVNRPSRMTLPASVRVASGRTTARFAVAAVGEPDASVTVIGRLGVAKTDVILVTALRVRIELPARVFADVPTSGRVLLNGEAPAGGAGIPVDLTMSVPTTAAPPASVTVQPGVSAATFGFTAPSAAPGDSDGLTAQVRGRGGPGATAFRKLDVESNLRSVTVAPAGRGATTTGTVRLHSAYPRAVDVALALGDPAIATVPPTVRMIAGQTVATFDVRLKGNGVTTLTATSGSSTAAGSIEVGIVGGFDEGASRVYPGVTTAVRLRLRPLPDEVTLELRSSDAGVVAFASTTVTVPAGGDGTVELPVRVKALGEATLSASYDGVTLSRTVTASHVVRRIELLDPPALGEVDARLAMGLIRSESYTVALSSNSGAVSVPASVTVPAGASEAPFRITIQAPGSADITATYGGVAHVLTVSTGVHVDAVTIQGVYVGAEATGVVTLSGDVPAATVVELFAADPSIVVVPAAVTVPAGADRAVFPITGAAPGTTTVSARIGGYDRSTAVTTRGLVASVEAPGAMLGLPATGRVTIAVPQAGPVEISLASGDPATAAVPATVTIPAAASSVAFPIATHRVGTAGITASFGGVAVAADVSIAPLFERLAGGPAHYAGEVETATLRISLPAPRDLQVTLASSAPAVATVPATATVPEGAREIEIRVANVATGTTTITATLAGQTATATWAVVDAGLASVTVSDVYAGLGATGVVTLGGPAAGPVAVALRESGGDLLTVPRSVTVPAGASSAAFTFTARRVGETTLRATVAGQPERETAVTVVQIVDDLSLPEGASVGEPATGTLTLVAPAPEAFEVRLSSSQPEIATVPATLTVPAGEASLDVPITPVGVGATRVTVTFGELSLVRDLSVGAASTLAGLSVPPLYAGLSAFGEVQLAAGASEETVVRLTSGDTGVVTVPATATVRAGEATGSFALTAVGVGTTTIGATLDGVTVTSRVTVGGFVRDIGDAALYPLVEGQVVGVSFAAAPAGPLTLGVAVDSAIVSVPATVGVSAGATGVAVPVTVSGSGSFTLTVTVNGFPHAETLTVSPLLRDASCGCPVVEGSTATATVRLNAAPAGAFNIRLSSDDPGVASVPVGMLVAAGASSAELTVTANGPGTATVTASWNGESVAFTVEVTADARSAAEASTGTTVGASDGGALVSPASPAGAARSVGPGGGEPPAGAAARQTVATPGGSRGAGITVTGMRGGATVTVTVGANSRAGVLDVVVEGPCAGGAVAGG